MGSKNWQITVSLAQVWPITEANCAQPDDVGLWSLSSQSNANGDSTNTTQRGLWVNTMLTNTRVAQSPALANRWAGFQFPVLCLSSSSSVVLDAALPLARSDPNCTKSTRLVAMNTTFKVESLCALVCCGINLHIFLEAMVRVRQCKAAHTRWQGFLSFHLDITAWCLMYVGRALHWHSSVHCKWHVIKPRPPLHIYPMQTPNGGDTHAQQQYYFPINCGMMNYIVEWLFKG